MVGWYHRLNGHEFERTLADGEGQGNLACCRPWGLKESDTTEGLNDNKALLSWSQVSNSDILFVKKGNYKPFKVKGKKN